MKCAELPSFQEGLIVETQLNLLQTKPSSGASSA